MVAKQKKLDKTSVKSQTPSATSAPDKSVSKVLALSQYFEDAKTELGKVSWPTRKEVKVTSFAVLLLVVIMSFFLGIVDLLLASIVESILSIGL